MPTISFVPFTARKRPYASEQLTYYIPIADNDDETELDDFGTDVYWTRSELFSIGRAIPESEVDERVAQDGNLHKKLEGRFDYSNRIKEINEELAIKTICDNFYRNTVMDIQFHGFDRDFYKKKYYRVSNLRYPDYITDIYFPESLEALKTISKWAYQHQEYSDMLKFELNRSYTFSEVEERKDRRSEHMCYSWSPLIRRETMIYDMQIDLPKSIERIIQKYRIEFLEHTLNDGGIEKFMAKSCPME